MQGQHELPVLTNELTDLIHKEQDAAVWFLMGQPCVHVVGEITDRHRIRILIALDDGALLRLAGHCGVGFADLVIPQHGLVTAFAPRFAGRLLELSFEIIKVAVVCQITFEFRDARVLAIEATSLIEYADKGVQQRIGGIGFIRLLIDVEQNRRGGNRQRLFKLPRKHLIVLRFGLAHEGANDLLTAHGRLIALVDEFGRDLAQNVRQHFQQV